MQLRQAFAILYVRSQLCIVKHSISGLPRGKPHVDTVVVPQATLGLAPNMRVVTIHCDHHHHCEGIWSAAKRYNTACQAMNRQLSSRLSSPYLSQAGMHLQQTKRKVAVGTQRKVHSHNWWMAK